MISMFFKAIYESRNPYCLGNTFSCPKTDLKVLGWNFYVLESFGLAVLPQFKNYKGIRLAQENDHLAVLQSPEFTIHHPYALCDNILLNCQYII